MPQVKQLLEHHQAFGLQSATRHGVRGSGETWLVAGVGVEESQTYADTN